MHSMHSMHSGPGRHKMYDLFTGEKARGAVASIISGIVANGVNTWLILVGVDAMVSTAIVLQLFGNVLTYTLDVMIAKREFYGEPVSYLDLGKRFSWFLRSLVGPPIHKFVVAALIEASIVYIGLKGAREFCDSHDIVFRLRDPILAALIASLTFVLFMNILRFNWVLEERQSLIMDVVILAWMGVSVLVLGSTLEIFKSIDTVKGGAPSSEGQGRVRGQGRNMAADDGMTG